jgi:hypothetical protein
VTPLELMENQACHAIAQAVSCEHSPAVPGSHEAAAIHAAEEIARRIHERQERMLYLVVGDETPEDDIRNAMQAIVGELDCLEGSDPQESLVDLLCMARDRLALALAKLNLERKGAPTNA